MPMTFLSLPVEIRLQIYSYVFTSINLHSFRPQQKAGWNRSPLDLANPGKFFESDSHPTLRRVFGICKLTKHDHLVLLQSLLHHARILCVTHDDFTALHRLGSASIAPGAKFSNLTQARSCANIVKESLRTLDFSDKLDDIFCQPSDLVKLLKCLSGLKSIYLSTKHVQRYSGTIEDHIDFAKERAEQALGTEQNGRSEKDGTESNGTRTASNREDTASNSRPVNEAREESRRMRLRSPMTDGTRMLISPVSIGQRSTSGRSSCESHPQWVVVDISLLIWQHFLYTGAPYRDHWRQVKVQTLLDTAEQQDIQVIMRCPNIEFDPLTSSRQRDDASRRAEARGDTVIRFWQTSRPLRWSGCFRGEMSTSDWTLRLRSRIDGTEYTTKQRRNFGVAVSQEASGLVK